MNPEPLAITSEHIKQLGPIDAVNLLRELLWAEATRLGIGKNLIDVPSAITVGDGGVDAQVTDIPVGTAQGILKEGHTAYQVKTGDFSLSKAANVDDILFVERLDPTTRKRTKELHPRVKACFDKNGILVVALFGWDNPDTTDNAAQQKIVEALKKEFPLYADAKVEVWRPNQIAGFLKPFPSLRLSVLGGHQSGYLLHEEWSLLADMNNDLKAGPGQERFLEEMGKELRKSDAPVHVRVTGNPGIGKTKLVLESTRTEDLKPLTIYFKSPQDLLESKIVNHILLSDNVTVAILVVDECDATNRAEIWNSLQAASRRIRLVTIYSEPDPTTGTITYLNPDPLGDKEIALILESYGVPTAQTPRWIPFCSGSPRVAHILGRNLRNNPEDLLQEPDTVRVWDRFIAGPDKLDTEQFSQRKQVLMLLSLFKRFGYGRPYQEEGRLIVRKLEIELGIKPSHFKEIVADLKKRKLLQGQTTLYITPQLFHIWLWTQWWNIEGIDGQFNLDQFLTVDAGPPATKLTDALLDGFLEMFRYARDSQAANAHVKHLLSAEGVFSLEFLNTERGSRFFWRLAEADPPGALTCLNRTLGYCSHEQLLNIGPGRRNLIWALQGLAIWRDLFGDAARHLLALAEAENENWSNNASGVFAGMFSVGVAPVAPTEASPAERFPVLREALTSESKLRRALGFQACAAAFWTHGSFRMLGPEHQGLRKEPELWQPKTWSELYEAYRMIWNELCGMLDHMEADERENAVTVLLDGARELTQMPALAQMVTETLTTLVEHGHASSKAVLKEVEEILYFDKQLPEEVRNGWIRMRDELTGTTFSELLRRFVGLDLYTDHVDKDSQSVDKAKSKIDELAQQAISDPTLLIPELGWLMTTDAQNGYAFGYALGQHDKEFSLLEILISALLSAGPTSAAYMLGGYFRALCEHDEVRWENELDTLSADPNFVKWIPELTWRSGSLTDRAGHRVLRLAREGAIGIEHLRIFAHGASVGTLSVDIFGEWLAFLLEKGTSEAIALALNLADFYFLRIGGDKEKLPEQPTFTLLIHPVLFDAKQGHRFDSMTEYHWSELGKNFVDQHPECGLAIASLLLKHIADDTTIAGGFQSQTRAVLNEVTRLNPAGVWTIVSQFLDAPLDTTGLHIRWWLKGDGLVEMSTPGTSDLMPVDQLWAWIDADSEKRAYIAASIVPPVLSKRDGQTSLAYQLLVRYGEREDVRAELSASYFSHGWSGPSSAHYADLRQHLLNIRKDEQNANVKRWIDEQISHLDRSIEQALAEEERLYT